MNKLRSSGSSQAAKLEDEVKAKSAECCQLEAKLNQQGDYEDLKRELRLKVTNLCLCVCLFVCFCVCVFVCLFVCLFICLFVLFFHATTTIITSLTQSPLYFLTTIHFSHFTPNATTTTTEPPPSHHNSRHHRSVLKSLEFSYIQDTPASALTSKSLETLLMEKNRALQTENTTVKCRANELQGV